MSIALNAKVEALEKQVNQLADAHLRLQVQLIDAMDRLLKVNERIAALEQTAVRKPGPKPKDANG